MILVVLSLKAAGGFENASKDAAAKLDQVAAKAKADADHFESRIASGGEPLTDEEVKKYKHAQVAKKYSGVGFVTGPGMGRDFLPLGLACSFFVV